MMNGFDYSYRTAQLHIRELLEQAEKDRLSRQADRARPRRPPRRWRRHLGALLIAAGDMLVGSTLDAARPSDCAPSHRPT